MRTVSLWFCSLAAALAADAAIAAGAKVFDQTIAAPPHGVVEISNVAGSVKVSGWDRQEVAVHAELDSGVERVEMSNNGNRTSIKVVLPSHASHGEAHLHVQMPKDSELDVSAVSADVATTGVTGVQRLNAVSGDVSSELAGADFELKTVSGDVRLHGHGQPARLHISTVSGDVHLEHGAGDLEAGSVSGSLVVSLDSAKSVRVRTTSGDVRFEGRLTRGADLEATTVSGDVEMRVSGDGGYGYEARSFSGEIRDCFDVKAEPAGKVMPGTTLQGKRDEGASNVRVKSMSGDIELCELKLK